MKPFDLQQFFLLSREKTATSLFFVGIAIAYFGSLNPWFMWPFGSLYVLGASSIVFLGILIDQTSAHPFFDKSHYLPATIAYVFLTYYLLLVNEANVNGYIVQTFSIILFYSLFRSSISKLQQLSTFICKLMAVLLSVSIPFFFLYLIGFPLPSRDAVFGEDALYSYTNYYFFMIDDRSLWSLFIPRFHSVFLEPGHLGTATVLLLFSQVGRWKKWYNVILIIATLMTFSLAAYVLFVCIIILASWMKRKQILKKLMGIALGLATIVTGSFFYNDGDNMINELIVMRLEVEDGEMAGDNRVSDDFKGEYESFLKSSDVFFGREMDKTSSGNSGFRVFIYENGFVGLFLVVILYFFMPLGCTDKRPWLAYLVIAALCFIVRGYPLWYSNVIPLLATAYLDFKNRDTKQQQ